MWPNLPILYACIQVAEWSWGKKKKQNMMTGLYHYQKSQGGTCAAQESYNLSLAIH